MNASSLARHRVTIRTEVLRTAGRLAALLAMLPTAIAAQTPPAPTPSTQTAAASASFAGTWETTYGEMQCNQTADRVSGTYEFSDDDPGRIDGRVNGRKLTFHYKDSDGAGQGWFELAADGQSFAGQWRKDGDAEWEEWTGKRAGSAASGDHFDGLWKTRFGPMRLRTVGDEVVGTYAYAGISNIRGKIEHEKLRFQYDQPDGERGSGEFELATDGASFDGRWTTNAGGGGRWTGARIVPVPGRTWLIVLESNWEGSLAEHEYSYGQMLRSFFTRLPNVRVRHRFVHSAADFQRWAAEAAYFAEPVVLYVSSHGTRAGIVLGSEVVGADALIAGLRDAGSLRLLHFGSCEVMSGDVPARIAAARPAAARFPISGFSKTADWGGSAIVDFTYLELVIGKNMPPAEAGRLTREMVKFACEDSDGPIPGSGLMVYTGEDADAKVAQLEIERRAAPATRPAAAALRGAGANP
jgi:hypothetical protein